MGIIVEVVRLNGFFRSGRLKRSEERASQARFAPCVHECFIENKIPWVTQQVKCVLVTGDGREVNILQPSNQGISGLLWVVRIQLAMPQNFGPYLVPLMYNPNDVHHPVRFDWPPSPINRRALSKLKRAGVDAAKQFFCAGRDIALAQSIYVEQFALILVDADNKRRFAA